jgi:hypothetical protein
MSRVEVVSARANIASKVTKQPDSISSDHCFDFELRDWPVGVLSKQLFLLDFYFAFFEASNNAFV